MVKRLAGNTLTARDVYDQMQKDWKGSREFLLAQLVRLVEQFIGSGRISITPALFHQDELKRRLIITLNMTRVVQHIWEAIRFENTEALEPVWEDARTGDQGHGHRAGSDRAAVSGRMGESRERARGVRSLVLGCFTEPG